MPDARDFPLQLWLAYWRYKQWYHSYTVEGLEHLDGKQPALIVGYHGRPFAWDMGMLMVTLFDRLGYLPHAIVNRSVNAIPPLKWLSDGFGFVCGDDGSLAAAVARGEHIMVTPGGPREAARSFRSRYQVAWGEHISYLRLALKYHLRIVPVAAAGTDSAYIGLNDAVALGIRLGLPHDWAWLPWFGLGPFGLFPFSPPFPVKMHQVVGAPIDLRVNGKRLRFDDRDAVLRLHRRVVSRVQSLLDRARQQRRQSSRPRSTWPATSEPLKCNAP